MQKRVLNIATSIALCTGFGAIAHADCYDRYAAALDATQQTYANAPIEKKPAIAAFRDALRLVRMKVGIDENVLPRQTCTTVIASVEAQTLAWHQMGWWKTQSEQEAQQDAAAAQAFKDALNRLQERS